MHMYIYIPSGGRSESIGTTSVNAAATGHVKVLVELVSATVPGTVHAIHCISLIHYHVHHSHSISYDVMSAILKTELSNIMRTYSIIWRVSTKSKCELR